MIYMGFNDNNLHKTRIHQDYSKEIENKTNGAFIVITISSSLSMSLCWMNMLQTQEFFQWISLLEIFDLCYQATNTSYSQWLTDWSGVALLIQETPSVTDAGVHFYYWLIVSWYVLWGTKGRYAVKLRVTNSELLWFPKWVLWRSFQPRK